jgi:hypothetical protein
MMPPLCVDVRAADKQPPTRGKAGRKRNKAEEVLPVSSSYRHSQLVALFAAKH